MKQLYVRVHLKTGAEKFHRCGMAFTREWQKVEVDAATAKRLEEEQMLEVSADVPADYVAEAAAAPAAENTPVVPTDPAVRMASIKDAIAKLDKDDTSVWTNGGAPKTSAIEAVTGWPVSADERNAAWTEFGTD